MPARKAGIEFVRLNQFHPNATKFGDIRLTTLTAPVTILFPRSPFIRCVSGGFTAKTASARVEFCPNRFGVLPPGQATLCPEEGHPSLAIWVIPPISDDERPQIGACEFGEVGYRLYRQSFRYPIGTIFQIWPSSGLNPSIAYNVIETDGELPKMMTVEPTFYVFTGGQGHITTIEPSAFRAPAVVAADTGLPMAVDGQVTLDIISVTDNEHRPIHWC